MINIPYIGDEILLCIVNLSLNTISTFSIFFTDINRIKYEFKWKYFVFVDFLGKIKTKIGFHYNW